MKRLLTSLVVACAALALFATVFAHAEPAEVNPGVGANVIAPPPQIQIVMSQEMAIRDGANDIDVLDSTGKEVTRIAAVVDRGDRRRISVVLPTDLAPGEYTVRWKTLSAEDGDADDGEYTFTYDPTRPEDPGQTNLREDVPQAETPANGDDASAPPAVIAGGGGDDGMSWVLVAAVGLAGLAIGSGATFLLVQRRP